MADFAQIQGGDPIDPLVRRPTIEWVPYGMFFTKTAVIALVEAVALKVLAEVETPLEPLVLTCWAFTVIIGVASHLMSKTQLDE